MLEVLAKGEHHVAGIEALAGLAVDQGLQIDIGRIGFADRDARPERTRRIEILWKGKIERAAGRLARRPDTPIREDRHTPDVILQLRRLQITAALAEHDGDLALVIQAIAAVGVDNLAVGTNDLPREFPETPEPGFADFLVSIPLIRPPTHFLGHRRGVIGEVAAAAGNAGVVGPRRMEAYIRGSMYKRLASCTQFIMGPSEEVIERLLRVFEGARAAFDQARQIGRHQRLGHFQRAGLIGALPQVFGAGMVEIDDIAVAQCTGAPAGAEYDDFHWMRILSECQPATGGQPA